MSTTLRRVGASVAAHPWRALGAWLVVLVSIVMVNSSVGGQPHDNYDASGIPSQTGTQFLRSHFPEMSGADARVVIHDRTRRSIDAGVLATVKSRLAELPGVSVVSPPRFSTDQDTAIIAVQYRVPVTSFKGDDGVSALTRAAAPARDAGLEVELGGSIPENATPPNDAVEDVGVALALIILLLTLGSLVGAGLSLLVAIAGLGVGLSIVGLLAAVTDISVTAPTIATMVGLGVGIDYALFLVSRHLEGLRQGLSAQEAAAMATATAGPSVLVAGLTVLVSLFGLKLAGLPVYASFGYATFATVGAAMLAAITVVPALCALAGRRMLPRRERRGGADRVPSATLTQRWASRVVRRPVASTLIAVAILATLAAPVLGMRTWPQDASSQPTSNTTRRAYDLIASEFGSGANGPFLVVVDTAKLRTTDALVASLKAEPGVATVSDPVTNAAGDAAVIVVEPTTGPQDVQTPRVLRHIRAEMPAGVSVTGWIATLADDSQRLSDRLWLVVGFVAALSLLLLTVLLRAPVMAVKAALMNLASVAAAYGVITAIFQTDVGAHLVGLPHKGAVSSWVPILMFTILFGLSMDYEVFLLSRVREAWQKSGDPRGSVVTGLGATGRVITSAAAIMISVFIGFALDSDVTVKTIGIGLAVAVFIDATLVRTVLVPATMTLLGRANWWSPRWLGGPTPSVQPAVAGTEQPIRTFAEAPRG